MKTLATISLTLFLYLSMWASGQPAPPPSSGCRLTFSAPSSALTAIEQVRLDLVSGTWQCENVSVYATSMHILQFGENGYAYWLTGEGGAPGECLRYSWTLAEEKGQLYLYLRNKQTHRTFTLESTCEGLNLQEQGSATLLAFRFQQAISTDSLARVIKQLTGKWEHSPLAPDIFVEEGLCATREQAISAVFRYSFRPDGTFSKGLHSDELGIDLIDEGRWRLSGDGKYLLLERFEADAPYVETIQIKYLNLDELVLCQIPAFNRAVASRASRDLFFNKI
ncbi:MAG: hypothetical protein KIPDCIKN_01755 [Haliscomenobacter sp.]|jgi:hypothetical protein|nr:hypothetical protein [Haliscomenobacter sp.]